MSEMMGYGGMGFGGSSSSTSNLSPLAPPFTVDRWNPKPSSTPPLHVTESSYDVPVYSSFHNWHYPPQSSSSRPDLYANCGGSEIDSIRTTPLPWDHDFDYQYFGSVSNTSPSVPPVNPNVSSDTFTYLKYPNDIQNPSVGAKPYHPQASPALDDHIPTVVYSEPTYDLLSSSRVDPSDVPSRVDYTQILTGLDYTQPWGSFWSGIPEEDQAKRNFCEEEINTAGSYGNRSFAAQGVCTTESFSGREEVGIAFGRRESQIVSPIKDDRYSAKDPRFTAGISSKAYTSGVRSAIPESHAVATHLQTDSSSWSHQKPYGPVYDSFFPSFDSCVDESISVKKTSPAVIIRPPSTGTASTMQNGLASETLKSKNISDHNSLSNKPVQKDVMDHMSMAGKEFQLFEKNVSDGFTLELGGPKGFVSVNDTSECIDHYNPSVDSPCWKGAPASRFFPSDVSEAATAQQVTKELEKSEGSNIHQTYPSCTDDVSLNLHQTCFPRAHNDSLNVQQTQTLQPTDDSSKVSRQNMYESTAYLGNGYAEIGSLLYSNKAPDSSCAAKEDISADTVTDASSCLKPNSSTAAQAYLGTEKAINECNLPNRFASDSDMKSSDAKRLGLDEGEVLSRIRSEEFVGVADSGLHVNADPEGPSLLSLGVGSTSLLPDSTKEGNKLAGHATGFPPKLNVQMLVNTMHNLSELLMFHYSTGVCTVSEQDQEILKRILNNTSTCLSKMVLNKMPMQESLMSCTGVLREYREAAGPHKGVSAGSSSHDLSDQNSINEGSKKNGLSGKAAEKSLCATPSRDDANITKDVSLVRALKEVLEENFDGDDEMKPETLLFKNLWLEAEAALCSVNFRSRYNHVKNELEKGKPQKPKDLAENTQASGETPNPKVSCDANATHKAAAEARDDGSVLAQYESLDHITVKIDDDIDDSVLARLRVLKLRDQQDSNCVNKGNFVATGFMDNGSPQAHCGDDKCMSLPTKDVESTKMVDEVPSINGTPTVEAVDRDSLNVEDSVQRKIIDDVDASVLARLRILKCRGEGSDSINMEGKQLVHHGGLETSFMDNVGRSKMDSVGSFARDFYRERVKEFGPTFATEESANSYGDNRSGTQLSSGWGGSSDWEHVLKDEYVYQKW